MLAYDHLVQSTLPPLLPASVVPLLSGMIARCSISALISPLELVRTNLQSTPASLNEPQTLRSVLTSIRGLVRSQGVSSLWRGLGPTLWRDAPFSGVYWTSYEYIKGKLAERHIHGPWVAFTGGAMSGVIAVFFTSPFDVMKTRRQALLLTGRVSNVSAFPFLLNIARTEGWRALFAGLQPRVAKIIPFCGVMVGCFEVCFWVAYSSESTA
jgi:solute carrier family 25 protein 39/40